MIAIIALIISVISVVLTVITIIIYNKNLLVAYGMQELEMISKIADAEKDIIEFISKNKPSSPDYTTHLKILNKHLLNVYDILCALYFDKKIDKKRFEVSYTEAIRNLYSINTVTCKFLSNAGNVWYNIDRYKRKVINPEK